MRKRKKEEKEREKERKKEKNHKKVKKKNWGKWENKKEILIKLMKGFVS